MKESSRLKSEGVFTETTREHLVAVGSYIEGRGGKFNSHTVSQIKDMTARNMLTEALIKGAQMLGYMTLVKKLTHVKGIQDLEGHLPHFIDKYRYELHNQFFAAAKRDLSPEQYDSLHSAY